MYPPHIREAAEALLKVHPIYVVKRLIREQYGHDVAHPTLTNWKNGVGSKRINEIRAANCTSSVQQPVTTPILLFDIETLPNEGYFFDTYSERNIPLNFIKRPKAICTLSYKWLGDETTVLVMSEPYDDRSVLEAFLPVYEKAMYAVAHFGDGFDIPFIQGRLFANKLPQLPERMILDTYKIAKQKWRGTLNSNKLDHLGMLLGVGRKNKTDADLWVRCAEGDPEAIKEMAAYNIQDVELLERVFTEMRPLFGKKLNLNLMVDNVTNRCKPCGSENIALIGYRMTGASMRPQYRCGDCSAVSDFPKVEHAQI